LLAAKHSLPNERSVPKRIRKPSHEESSGECPAAIILQISPYSAGRTTGMSTKVYEEKPQEPKSRWDFCTAWSCYPSTDTQLFFFSVPIMDPTYFHSDHKQNTESFILSSCKSLSSSHLWLTGPSLFVSLDSGCVWRKVLDLGRPGEYSAKWQEVLKLSSNKNRSERCPPEQENESKDGFVTWARVWQNLELSADSFVSLRREHG
jgi:hypothetical protein